MSNISKKCIRYFQDFYDSQKNIVSAELFIIIAVPIILFFNYVPSNIVDSICRCDITGFKNAYVYIKRQIYTATYKQGLLLRAAIIIVRHAATLNERPAAITWLRFLSTIATAAERNAQFGALTSSNGEEFKRIQTFAVPGT